MKKDASHKKVGAFFIRGNPFGYYLMGEGESSFLFPKEEENEACNINFPFTVILLQKITNPWKKFLLQLLFKFIKNILRKRLYLCIIFCCR